MAKENLFRRLKREIMMRKYIRGGYTRKLSSRWCKRIIWDNKKYAKDERFLRKDRKNFHNNGFLCSTIEKYNITQSSTDSYVSDFKYLYLKPFNNSFSKWLTDITFMDRILLNHRDVQVKIFYTVIIRDGNRIILPYGGGEREYTIDDIREFLKENGMAVLRPTRFASHRARFTIGYDDDGFSVDGTILSIEEFTELIEALAENYCIIQEAVSKTIFEDNSRHVVKLWVANDGENGTSILSAQLNKYYTTITKDEDIVEKIDCSIVGDELYEDLSNTSLQDEVDDLNQAMEQFEENVREERHQPESANRRAYQAVLVSLKDGTFEIDGCRSMIPRWDEICDKVVAIAEDLKQISYFSIHIVLTEDGLFKIVRVRVDPVLPEVSYNKEVVDYFQYKFELTYSIMNVTFKSRVAAIRRRMSYKIVAKLGRIGIRTYMQKLWMKAVWDDLLHTKGISLLKKIRAHRHGFLSYRIWQYGLTNKNYKDFLSDYDYHWLNRINNKYQRLINDKTTYRFTMEPFKQYVPKYYFSVFSRNGGVEIVPMPDCPEDITADMEGLEKLLKKEGKLAFKASAGAHGDGFYCLSYSDGQFEINDEKAEIEDIRALIESVKSFYIITEFLYMHDELRRIYDKTVNTVRVMVINKHGYDPKIMQTYMRIGASKTGYTDNVGYGGICAMVDTVSGEIYNPETLTEHRFHPCPLHPDTGVEIKGIIPNWELLKKEVCAIARYLCELEYLGFDVAITNNGLQILEINIHQDLHKVADFNEEIKSFYDRKIIEKKKRYKKLRKKLDAELL